MIICSRIAHLVDSQHNTLIACRSGVAGCQSKSLIFSVLSISCVFNRLKINGLLFLGKENVKFFEKILQKNLEDKKKSVSLQPV